ncbi:hypothetical protein K502DRAFT_332739 [Neoconidiobolus thromboides FSU 785]|nr:hypothetical protein K502DRAFT_332739 [Neoconidiobolus thromboides FSU 785]
MCDKSENKAIDLQDSLAKKKTSEKEDKEYNGLYTKLNKYKTMIKNWEYNFKKKYNRDPRVEDIDDFPVMVKNYKMYAEIKKNLMRNFTERYKEDVEKIKRGSKEKSMIKNKEEKNNINEIKDTSIEEIKAFISPEKSNLANPSNETSITHFLNQTKALSEMRSASLPEFKKEDDIEEQKANIQVKEVIEKEEEIRSLKEYDENKEDFYYPPTPENNCSEIDELPVDNESRILDREEIHGNHSIEATSSMEIPPPTAFSKLFVETPVYWQQLMAKFIVPKGHPKYMDRELMKQAKRICDWTQYMLVKHFGDILEDPKFRINSLPSYPYAKPLTPYSFRKPIQRIRGYQTAKEILEEKEKGFIFERQKLRGWFNNPRLNTKNITTYKPRPKDEDGNEIPLVYPWTFEDEHTAKGDPTHYRFKFPLKEKDPRYMLIIEKIRAQEEAKREEEERKIKEEEMKKKEEAKAKRIARKAASDARKSKPKTGLKDSDLVSTNFVKMDTRRGKYRTGTGKPKGASRIKISKYCKEPRRRP